LDKFELETINVLLIDILRELGISTRVKGYQHIITAVKILRENPDSINAMTKELYPGVSKIHGEDIRGSRIEKGIRTAVGSSKADDVTWHRILGTAGHLTNTKFLAALVREIEVRAKLFEIKKGIKGVGEQVG